MSASHPADGAALAAAKGAADPMVFRDDFESPQAPPPDGPPLAVKVLNKIAYGPRPGDIATFNALGGNDNARLEAWVDDQLDPDTIPDTACDHRVAAAGYTPLDMTVAQLWAKYARGDSTGWPVRYHPTETAYCVKVIRALYSERQLFEIMVDFWHSHFNVMGWEYGIAPVFQHYDRDVMRGMRPGAGGKRYALGNFRALLEEVAKSPAMLMYLDNKSSRGISYNENYARELCELHTLGAQNYYGTATAGSIPRYPDGLPKGYSDFYVYEAARCFTGWTMRDGHWEFPNQAQYDTGEFLYWEPWHDRSGKNFLARGFDDLIEPDQPALSDGRNVLDRLASHPGTAQHLCGKLCRRFIGDNPPQSLVDSAASIWQEHWQAQDQIARVLRHILLSDAFKSTWAEKAKRPWEALMHAMRATSADFTPRLHPVSGWDDYVDFNERMEQTGNGPFRWPTPDGFPDTMEKWQSVSPLSQTWRFCSRLIEMRTTGSGDRAFFLRIEQQTKAGLTAPNRSATKIVDFWIGRIFGYEIAPARRQSIIDFLRQNADANAALNLDEDDSDAGIPRHQGVWQGQNLSRHYTIARLRAAVGLLLMLPEFFHR